VGSVSPAKFIYNKRPEEPSTEVGLLRGLSHDIYTIVGVVNPETKRATLNFHINPLVGFVWIGLLTLLCGCFISLWPEFKERELGAWAYIRTGASVAASVAFAVALALTPTSAFALSLPRAGSTPTALQGEAIRGEHLAPHRDSGRTRAAVGVAIAAGLGLGATQVFARRRSWARS
jgi:cytochrome c-type biogenesis protein CcmF